MPSVSAISQTKCDQRLFSLFHVTLKSGLRIEEKKKENEKKKTFDFTVYETQLEQHSLF